MAAVPLSSFPAHPAQPVPLPSHPLGYILRTETAPRQRLLLQDERPSTAAMPSLCNSHQVISTKRAGWQMNSADKAQGLCHGRLLQAQREPARSQCRCSGRFAPLHKALWAFLGQTEGLCVCRAGSHAMQAMFPHQPKAPSSNRSAREQVGGWPGCRSSNATKSSRVCATRKGTHPSQPPDLSLPLPV